MSQPNTNTMDSNININPQMNNDTMMINLRDELSSIKSMVKMKDDRIEYLSNQFSIANNRLKECQEENFKYGMENEALKEQVQLLQQKLKGDQSLKWLRGQYLDSAKIEIDSLKIENKNLNNQLSNLREVNKNNESSKDSVLDAYKSEISNLNIQINKLEILNQKFKNDIIQFEERKD